MKLLIWTWNISENNDYVEWDGDGPCPEEWEAKPGLTYVLRDLTDEEIATMDSKVISVLKEEIEQVNEEGFVTIDIWHVVDDDEEEEDYTEIIRPYDDPEKPFILRYVPNKTD